MNNNEIELKDIQFEDFEADMFTNPLNREKFKKLKSIISVKDRQETDKKIVSVGSQGA